MAFSLPVSGSNKSTWWRLGGSWRQVKAVKRQWTAVGQQPGEGEGANAAHQGLRFRYRFISRVCGTINPVGNQFTVLQPLQTDFCRQLLYHSGLVGPTPYLKALQLPLFTGSLVGELGAPVQAAEAGGKGTEGRGGNRTASGMKVA